MSGRDLRLVEHDDNEAIPAEVVMWCCSSCGWMIEDGHAADPQPCEAYLGGDEDGSCGDCVRVVFLRPITGRYVADQTAEGDPLVLDSSTNPTTVIVVCTSDEWAARIATLLNAAPTNDIEREGR